MRGISGVSVNLRGIREGVFEKFTVREASDRRRTYRAKAAVGVEPSHETESSTGKAIPSYTACHRGWNHRRRDARWLDRTVVGEGGRHLRGDPGAPVPGWPNRRPP